MRNRQDLGAVSAPMVVLWALVLVFAAAAVYVFTSQARDAAQSFSDVSTGAPLQANAAAVVADVQNLRLAVETSVVDSGDLPTVTFVGTQYVVTGSGGDLQNVPAGAGVSAAGITGDTENDYCVWVAAQDGITMHTSHSGQPAVGGC